MKLKELLLLHDFLEFLIKLDNTRYFIAHVNIGHLDLQILFFNIIFQLIFGHVKREISDSKTEITWSDVALVEVN
jgi:hypothetical protein